jgi:membrane protease subunit (stomatin/prohibitin family)
VYFVSDLEDQLHAMIAERMATTFADSNVPFLDMAQNQSALAAKIGDAMKPGFAALGLEMSQFVVESVSLPDELQKVMDQRIGMNMAGDIGKLTQFETAESLEEAAQNPGGTAGVGVGLGAGAAMAQSMMSQTLPGQARGGGVMPAAEAESKFCMECGKPMPAGAKFCPACGKQQ